MALGGQALLCLQADRDIQEPHLHLLALQYPSHLRENNKNDKAIRKVDAENRSFGSEGITQLGTFLSKRSPCCPFCPGSPGGPWGPGKPRIPGNPMSPLMKEWGPGGPGGPSLPEMYSIFRRHFSVFLTFSSFWRSSYKITRDMSKN